MDREIEIGTFAKDTLDFAQEYIDSMRPCVLLLGPDMDGDGPSAKLRRELSQLCWELGTTILTEHDEIEKAGKKITGGARNLARWEILVAQKSHLVIIIPDSPGSFAELGTFSQIDKICSKMLVLFDKQYKKDKSYLQRGSRKAAEERRAAVLFVDYSEVDKVWQKVSSYIKTEKGKMADKLD